MFGIKLHYKLSDNSKKMLVHGIKNCTKALKNAGAIRVRSFGPVRDTGWHIMGTAKMGIDPKKSVVNKFGQSHDVKNLFIVDSSVFTTSAGVNPFADNNGSIIKDYRLHKKKYFKIMLIKPKEKNLLKKFLDVLIPKTDGMPSFSEAVNFNSFLILLNKSLSRKKMNKLLSSIKDKQAEFEDVNILNEISDPIATNLIEQYFSSKKVIKKLKKLKVY